MTAIDEALAGNAAYAATFGDGGLPGPPRKKLALVVCMDARIDIYRALALDPGDAHIIRNAGGIVTDDTIRSLLISQRLLGTREIAVIHHTRCGMETFSEDALKREVEADTGVRPPFALEAFGDLEADVRQSLRRLEVSPFVDSSMARGFIYDVATGRITEVHA